MQRPGAISTHNSSRPHAFVIIPPVTFERLSAILLFVAIACAACFMPAQNDTWWHLRAGEEIWRTHRVSLLDTFSHTAYGTYWPDHEWLSQALFFALYRFGGLTLLTAVLAAVVTATWVLVWRLTPGRYWVRLLIVGLAVVPSSIAWSLRPQVFTLFFIALTVFLLSRRRQWWLPPVFLVWANLHGAVLFGLVILAAVTMGTALSDRRKAGGLLGLTLLCSAMTCLTPLGFSFWSDIPASLTRIDHGRVIEWHAPQFSDPVLAPFWILTAAFVTMLVLHRTWRAPEWLGNGAIAGALAMVPLALGTGRNVPVLMVLIVPALASLVDIRFPVYEAGTLRSERLRLNAVVACAAMVVAFGIAAQAWSREVERLGWHPLPPQAIAAIEMCPEQLYNRYDEGGFLIWFTPARKVFLDSRYDPFSPELLLGQIALEESGEYRTTFGRYDIQCAFIPANSLLARRLADDGWRTTFRDSTWAVLVGKAGQSVAVTQQTAEERR